MTPKQIREALGPTPWWDGNEMRYSDWKPEPYPFMPGWYSVPCHCCNGIRWDGDYPVECERCGGNGNFAVHDSGAMAAYPGGPFVGHLRFESTNKETT